MSLKVAGLQVELAKARDEVQLLRDENCQQHTQLMRFKPILWGLFYVRTTE